MKTKTVKTKKRSASRTAARVGSGALLGLREKRWRFLLAAGRNRKASKPVLARAICSGFFTSHPRRKYIDARLTIKGEVYDAVLRLSTVHKSQRHLVDIGAGFKIYRSVTVRLERLPPYTKKDLRRADRHAKRYMSIFAGPNKKR